MTALVVNVQCEFDNFSLHIEHAFSLTGITGIYGHSGSGKSTLLRIIAGLNKHATGSIRIDETPLLNSDTNCFIKPEKRQLSMVFQDSRLFPHLTVIENLRFATKRSEHKHLLLDEIITLTDLTRLINMPVTQLSGGQQQRVALARALLAEPKLLLLDEPLSALDYASKNALLKLLTKVQQRLAIPILYVSHHLAELQQVADNLLVMAQGKVVNYGDIHEIIHRLNHSQHEHGHEYSDEHKHSTDSLNNEATHQQTSLSLPIKSINKTHQLVTLTLDESQEIHLPYNDYFADKITMVNSDKAPSQLRCFIFATDTSICKTEPVDSSIVNTIKGHISAIDTYQSQVLVTVNTTKNQQFFSLISSYSLEALALTVNMPIYLQFKASAVRTYLH